MHMHVAKSKTLSWNEWYEIHLAINLLCQQEPKQEIEQQPPIAMTRCTSVEAFEAWLILKKSIFWLIMLKLWKPPNIYSLLKTIIESSSVNIRLWNLLIITYCNHPLHNSSYFGCSHRSFRKFVVLFSTYPVFLVPDFESVGAEIITFA